VCLILCWRCFRPASRYSSAAAEQIRARFKEQPRAVNVSLKIRSKIESSHGLEDFQWFPMSTEYPQVLMEKKNPRQSLPIQTQPFCTELLLGERIPGRNRKIDMPPFHMRISFFPHAQSKIDTYRGSFQLLLDRTLTFVWIRTSWHAQTSLESRFKWNALHVHQIQISCSVEARSDYDSRSWRVLNCRMWRA